MGGLTWYEPCRVYVAVKHAEVGLWMDRMKELEQTEEAEVTKKVPKHALDKDCKHVCYPPELLMRY